MLLLFALLVSARLVMAQVVCYLPDMSPATGHVPCPGVNASSPGACCNAAGGWPHIDPCMTNGYCYGQTIGTVYRGSCSDSQWNAPGCATQCRQITDGDARISVCPSTNQVCCNDAGSDDCCSNGTLFDWPNSDFVGPVNASHLAEVIDVRGTISGISYTSNTTAATVTATVISSSAPAGGSVSHGALIGVGVGLGIPLAIALATIAWLALLLRKEKQRKAIGVASEPRDAQPYKYERANFSPSAPSPAPAYQPKMKPTPSSDMPSPPKPVSELYGGQPEPSEAPANSS